MSKNEDNIHKKAVYLPNNEPYLGRESVFQFDQVILSCLEANGKVAVYTHTVELSALRDKGDGSIYEIKGTVLFILTAEIKGTRR